MPEFRLPDLGEGVTEGEVLEWRVEQGAEVTLDQVLLVVGTDKATVEIPSPFAGRVAELLARPGERVQVGEALLRVETAGETPPLPQSAPTSARPETVTAPPRAAPSQDRPRAPALPSARRAARLLGVDVEGVAGSGPAGRVRLSDLPSPGRRTPLRGAQRVMAERMAHAHRVVPQVTVVLEVDAANLESLAGSEGGWSVLGLICQAVVRNLVDDPLLNARLDESAMEVVFHTHVGLGVAVQAGQDLLVANIPAAETLAPEELQRQLDQLVAAARAGSLRREQLTGATFTVSSGGRLGGLLATPIVNWPNLAILGVHAIRDQAMVRDGRVVAGRALNLSLSFDHRVIDGMRASAFLHRLADRLATPEQLLQAGAG
ncbi:MAG: dihydrolipoamide acetyltransferase family protein [Candidatus Dormibacteria bacterium]